MVRYFRYLIYIFFFIFSTGVLAEDTQPSDNEIHVVLIGPGQERSLISHPNFPSQKIKRGNCFGIDRINYTLLTNISFTPGPKDSYSVIQRKLLIAYQQVEGFFKERNKQVIKGFTTAEDFHQEMEQTWNHPDNPLRQAIESLQARMEGVHIVPRKTMKVGRKGQQVNFVQEEVQDIVRYLIMEVPLRVHLQTNPPHIVTMVGFKLNLDQTTGVEDFYVLDSNFPRGMRTLGLRKLENQDGSFEYFWVYGVPTQRGDIAYFKMKPLSWDEPYFPEEQKVAQEAFDVHFFYNKKAMNLTENEIQELIKQKVSVSGQ